MTSEARRVSCPEGSETQPSSSSGGLPGQPWHAPEAAGRGTAWLRIGRGLFRDSPRQAGKARCHVRLRKTAKFQLTGKILLASVFAVTPVLAQSGSDLADSAPQPAPRSIGTWAGWEAFTLQEAGVAVCTVVSRPFSVVPSMDGRQGLALTVARRPGLEDTVALAAGSAGIDSVRAELRMGSEAFPLDTGPDGIFVRDADAAIKAMKRSLQAVASLEESQGGRTTATYSLRGFKAAYGATRRVCPG